MPNGRRMDKRRIFGLGLVDQKQQWMVGLDSHHHIKSKKGEREAYSPDRGLYRSK